jgi:phosphate transport system substrate-binding protein
MLPSLPMTRACRRVVQAAFLSALSMPPLLAAAGEIRIGGTGNALGTIRLLAEAYMQQQSQTKVVVLPSVGTSGAIKAVPKGAIEIGLSSRTLTEEEAKSGISTTEYAQSPTVLAVHKDVKASSITTDQLIDIYSGKLSTWPDGARIRPVLRQPGDDNTRQLRSLSPEVEKAIAVAEQRPGALFAVIDQEAADKMESVPGGLGVTTVALIQSEKRSLRALVLDGVEPTPANAKSGRYPLIKHFHFVLPKEPAPEVQAFVSFVKSPQGRKILEQTGHTLP